MKYRTKGMVDFLKDIEGLDKVKATHYIEDILLFIKETLLNGDEIELKDIGVLKIVSRPARNVNVFDLKSNQPVIKTIPPRKVVKFKPSTILKRELNEDRAIESGGSNE